MHAALPLLNHFAELSRLSSTALIAAIWQGTLLALLATFALRLAPRIPAAARFAIWFAVFSLIAALPFLNHSSSAAATTPAPPHAAWLLLDSRWTLLIAAIWAAASLLRAATLIAAALRVRSLARNATPIELSHALTASAARRAQVCASLDIDRPTVIGFLAPKILIPAWLLEKLTPAELDHIVLHESGHLNRADDWLNLLQKLALVLFPLNPALAWVERRLCFERELACDERVLAALASREQSTTGYASSLTTLAEYRLQHRGAVRTAAHNLALALGALGRESELGRRIARILRPAARMRPLHVRLATGAAIAALLFTTTELEHSPQLISFASPAAATQTAAVESTGSDILPGYRAVSTRLKLPAVPQMKPVGDAAQRLNVQPRTPAPEPRAISVHADRTQQFGARMISVRDPEQQPGLVITRYTVTEYQSANGYRVVRTSTVISDAPPAATQDDQSRDINSSDRVTPSPRARQISQPYAAVPVPGGWLVFEL